MRTQKDVRILVLFFAVLGVGAGGVSGAFDSLTSRYLCKLQCSTLLADSPNIYSRYSSLCTQPNQQFSFGCQDLGCAGSCDSIILIIHNVNKSASFPLLSARYINKTEILLTWSSPPTPYYTRYLLQYRSYQKWTFVTEGPEMNYTYHNPNPCSPQQFRVIAVNQYGTKGFSNSLTVSAPAPPSAPQNPQLMEDAMFYHPHSKEFAGVLQVEGIQEWKQEDIDYYQWNKLPTIYCKNINSFVVPILDGLSSRDAVRAVSKCGVPGPYSNITIDLTDCSKIRNFNCQAWRNRIFNKPGNVENVTLTMDLHHPHIWLKVDWEKPTDMGSMGVISHYVMRWGKVRLPIFELEQPEFTHDPFNTTLPNNIVEFGIQVQEEPHTSYGFQIMPIAPTQVLRPSEYDMYQIFDITLKNRTSCQNNNIPASRISCDEDGVTVVHFSNTLDITVIWRVSGHSKRETDDKQGFDDKEFYEKYAIQLGEVKHVPPPVGLQLVKANVTVVESNQNMNDCEEKSMKAMPFDFCKENSGIRCRGVCEERRPSFTLCIPERDTIQYKNLQPEVLYGIRVIGLKKSEALPTEKRWRMKKVHTFVLNKTTEVLNTTLSTAISRDHVDYILVIVGVPIALLVVLLLLCCILRRRKKRELSSLDSHLLFGEASPDNPYNQIERAMRTATTLTVVADKWEIPHDCVRIGRMLGSGAFGYVVKGRINRSILRHRGIKEPFVADRKNMYVSVAVKLIQEEASETKKEEFLREIRLMKGIGYHNNVISMLGCCTLHDPICLIVEHATHGDLLSYLRNIRQRIQQSKINAEYVNQEIETVSPQELLSFARQISTGMEFLSQKGFIHRDLAARNILVDKKNLVKIGDFGLTRYTYDNKVYVNRKGGRLPLKWMSIEAINELTFSSASDVWSFGVLLFEIVTLGGTPYPTIDTRELLRELKNGYRMEKPENCSEEIYQIMRSCWREDPASRPSFTELRLTFDSLLEKSCGEHYVNFELDDSKLYYHLHDDLNSQNTATASISPSDIECFEKFEGTHETDRYPDVINHVEDVCTSEKRIPENKVSSLEFSEIQDTEVSTRTGSVKSTFDVSCFPNSRTVTFCKDSLETVPVRKRVRLGSPHTNKKYSTIATTKLNTDIPRQYRHDPLTSKASYSPDLESLPRSSVIDCDADESSIGSLCSKCSTSSNGDDDVFYSDSSNITREGPTNPYKLSGRPNLYRQRARTAPGFTTSFLSDDLQNDSGVSTSSVNDDNRFFVFPSISNRLSKTEKEECQAETTSSDIEVKSLSHDLGMSTDTCVWDSDEQTLDTYV